MKKGWMGVLICLFLTMAAFAQDADSRWYQGDLTMEEIFAKIHARKLLPVELSHSENFMSEQDGATLFAEAHQLIGPNEQANFAIYYDLAVISAARGLYDDVKHWTALALAQNPNDPYVCFLQGEVRFVQFMSVYADNPEMLSQDFRPARDVLKLFERVAELRPEMAPYDEMIFLAGEIAKTSQARITRDFFADKVKAYEKAAEQYAPISLPYKRAKLVQTTLLKNAVEQQIRQALQASPQEE